MSIVLQGSTSGSITLQEPAVAGSTVLSLPATTGTVLTSASPASDLPSSINGPAFSVSRITSDQSVSLTTYTKVQFNTVNFDTNNNWDSVNYRFTPTVAGYYEINLNITMYASTAMGEVIGVIYKNGAEHAWVAFQSTVSTARSTPQVSAVVYLNGSTDYVEGYGYITTGTSPVFQSHVGKARTQMSGCLVRAA